MKGAIASLVGALMVGAALALPAVSLAQPARGELARQRALNFPEMHEVRHKLNEARRLLKQRAAHDFHGHKTKALNHIEQAIQEINLGIESDGGNP
jgi:hypothetical protein